MDNSINKEQIEKIKLDMVELYKIYKEDHRKIVDNITYYNSIMFNPNNSHMVYEESELYVVELNEKDSEQNIEKTKYEIYKEGVLIATIDENQKIQFTQEYLENIKAISEQLYSILEKQNGKQYTLPEEQEKENAKPEEQQIKMTKLELEEKKKEEEEVQEQNTDETQEHTEEEPATEEESLEIIAEESGISKDDIKSCCSIKPEEKVTDEKTFEEIANVKGKYTKIFVVASNGATKGNSRFAFWGITEDGKAEQIEGLEERAGATTGKEIYSINRDGSEVKEEQTAALFTLPGQKEGFSVTIGQYGVIETEYIRRSYEENKYIGCSIDSSTQRPTTTQVQEFMNKNRTVDREMGESIKKAEDQLEETSKTKLENIDNDPNNDQALNVDQIITLHNDETTTLAKEAEDLGISLDEYKELFEEAEGDCPSDKINNIRNDFDSQDTGDDYDGMDRGERLTPEEEALRRTFGEN